ncbi:MAG: recombination mediator RecR [Planctomycetota bacterium]|nr:recombination mediator RecR [Planctomycetota bacterium]MDP6988266.1 recombination mediator RecR [Planctomycetota bacterium]
MAYPEPLEALIEAFERFPGIGRVSAERLAFHVLRDPQAAALASAIERAARETATCSVCCNIAHRDPCELCSDAARDGAVVCVVEQPRHVEAVERAGVFGGRYHVLMGALNPAEGTEDRHLSVARLVERVVSGGVEEVILATDPDAEGEATALLVVEALEAACPSPPLITRLARGLPAGSSLDYLHRGILEDALAGRRAVGPRTG